ncbi:hypothetical protein M409DRAFT_70619 [Zasmidium cellare ATCC 36951]|uniref:Anaphase-promoting complex subunit 5 n=1 Tax=Zasmidium cellare ATCC 36951 TaxID=1080233 RepID=A0A6A6BZR0_ZASCE|nr:uncharacterized protein M409DRAFT_70619 [Zasmidium cellare ATCC 36951]KAF2160284.1 hypothetical protein M409DRAFT_70619 [Zasmidium cellare ATCC 36951]
MPRYLTPARICCLVLIRQYQSGHTSSESSLRVLDFLATHVTASPENDFEAVSERNKLSSSDITYLAERLSPWSSKVTGRNMYDMLLKRIWSLHGLDSLHNLINRLNSDGVPFDEEGNPIPSKQITPGSPLGQFIRRCYVEFTRLQFADSQALWNSFVAYRALTYEDWATKNPDAARELEETQNLTNVPALPRNAFNDDTAEAKSNSSVVDADMLLGFSIYQLQNLGTRVPGDVKTQLGKWIGDQWDSGTQSLHFFMEFFDHWRSGQYNMALESLHRYFDYSLAARTGADNMRVYYQYALLHLSVLHADFECWDESVDAMNECIATARENQDTACLNFALSWLLYLRHAHPDKSRSSFATISGAVGSGGGEHDEIAFLKQKARDGKHWVLLSNTLLEEAKLEMFSGGSANRAQEYILQAMYLNVLHDLQNLAPAAALFHGASHDRLGQAQLATRSYELATVVHDVHCSLNDRVRSSCRLAFASALSGHYSKAMAMLDSLNPTIRGVLKLEQRILAFATIVQLRRQLHRGELEAASYFLNQLRPLRSFSDPEIVFEVNLLEIEFFIKQGSFEEALTKVGERIRESKGRGTDMAQRLHLLILKSRIYLAGGQAVKGFAVSLRATSTAERHLLMPVLHEGLAVLARILIELSEYAVARDLIEATLPQVLESKNVTLTAKMFVTMGEACVGFAGYCCEAGSAEQARSMRRALGLIERGRVAYQRIEDISGMLDCLLMKSKIANWSGDETTSAQADEMYMQLLADR